ncbi:type II secretion system protein GspM [Beijerinckia indica]|uniref:General secretion pathway protein M n=1 Tax=Beijerinckia indica subsp. indica (strain ATCC 9039 / DSM 1715 / NCIMB 8712) TaxID=395963 RepID=B2IBD6_BEII9|nr:type II secretion system protein GspM [Beijerinckia indica]ACB95223.1 hypothetical protein Bind_1591 [Beijerinckia indica subsp. indica ATCC 9039]
MMPPASFLSVLRKVRYDRAAIDWASLAGRLKDLATADLSFKGPIGALAALIGALILGVSLLWIEADETAGLKLERDAKTEQLAVLHRKQPAGFFSGNENGQNAETREPFILATTKTLAAAEVDRLLRAAVAETAGNLLSSRVEGAENEVLLSMPLNAKQTRGGQDHRIAADLVIEGKIEAVQALLFKLETDAPFFFIETLNLQPAQGGEQVSDSPLLRVTLKAVAYWRAPT